MTARKLIEAACEADDRLPTYDPRKGYATPLGKVSGMPGNYIRPEDVTFRVSRAGADAPVVLADVAYRVTARAVGDARIKGLTVQGLTPEAVVGTMEMMAPRQLKGAAGEAQYIAILTEMGEKILPPQDGDESRGIDIRTDRATYQVKTTTRHPLETKGRNRELSEVRKDADHLIWVRPDGKAVEVTE